MGAPALWHIDAAAAVVALDRAPAGYPASRRFDHESLPVVADGQGETGRHLVVDVGGRRHRLWLLSHEIGVPLVVLLPTADEPARVRAAEGARRLLAGVPAESHADNGPSSFQRQRLRLLLRVLDAAQCGLGTRAIGTRILYPWLAGLDAQAWKASSERRRTQRLVVEARHMMTTGYRQLLLA